MLASRNFGTFKSRSDLERFGSGNREHCMSQFSFELVEDGLSQARWDVTDNASYCTSNGILCFLGTDNALTEQGKGNEVRLQERLARWTHLGHAFSCSGVRATCGMFVDLFTGDGRQKLTEFGGKGVFKVVLVFITIGGRGWGCSIGWQMNFPHRRDECDYFNAVNKFQVLFSDCTGGNTSCASHSVRDGDRDNGRSDLPMVSRALLRPPPLLALMPYFSR